MAKKVKMEDEHSIAGPSSLARTCGCPGWLTVSKDFPQGEQHPAAAEGSRWHDWIEICNRDPDNAAATISKCIKEESKISGRSAGSEMGIHVKNAYDYTQMLIRKLKPILVEYESKFPCTYSNKDFGKCDVGLVYKRATGRYGLTIIDWKYGRGVYVSEVLNKQMVAYADAFWAWLKREFPKLSDIEVITTVIYQPRTSEDGRIARSCQYLDRPENKIPEGAYSIKEFKTLISDASEDVDTAYDMYDGKIEPEFNAGDHCMFCPAKHALYYTDKNGEPVTWGGCKAYAKLQEDLCPVKFDDIELDEQGKVVLPSVNDLTIPELLKIAEFSEKHKKDFDKFIKDSMTSLKSMLNDGKKIKGVKLVRTNTKRKWNPDMSVKEIADELANRGLKGKRYKPVEKQLINFTEAEKALGKSKKNPDPLSGLVVKPEGSLVVALESDPRPAEDPQGDINLLEDIEV